MQIANILSCEPLIIPIALDSLRLRKQQRLRLSLIDVAHTLDAQQIAQHAAPRTGLKFGLDA